MAAGPAGNPPSPIAKGGFSLAGRSERPDPATHAYRRDLADAALAGRVVASHYAEPLVRHLSTPAVLLAEANGTAVPVALLEVGDQLAILDISCGWAWGYGPDGRVGYVRSDALVP